MIKRENIDRLLKALDGPEHFEAPSDTVILARAIKELDDRLTELEEKFAPVTVGRGE